MMSFVVDRLHPHQVYRQDRPAAPVRQVVEPSGGVNRRATHRPSAANRRRDEAEGGDFQSVFKKALARNS